MRHLASLAAVSLISLPLAAQGEVDARSPAAKGSTAWLVHESTMNAKAEFRGQEMNTEETVAWTLHMVVADVDDKGNFLVDTKIVRVRGKLALAAGQGEAQFDSAGEADGAGAPIAERAGRLLAAAVGKSFRCKVSPRGEVLELGTGKDEVIDAAAHTIAMHHYDETLLQRLVGSAFGSVPEKRTAAGAKWNRTTAENLNRMPIRHQLANTLTLVDPDWFEIETTGTFELDLETAKKVTKEENVLELGQLEKTKFTGNKVEARQKVSRRDGFVLAANRTLSVVATTEDPRMGKLQASMTAAFAVTRTTEAEALAKPTAPKADTKPAGDKGK